MDISFSPDSSQAAPARPPFRAGFGGDRHWLTWAARFLALALLSFSLAAQAENFDPSRPTKIKAALLFHFLQLVKWPNEEAMTPDSPYVIGIVGNDPFGRIIDVAASNKIKGRNVVIKRFTDAKSIDHCHILFVGATSQPTAEIMKAIANKPTLSVGETEKFIDQGGMIGFVLKPDESKEGFRVRFEVNLEAAKKRGFWISSQLLELAVRILQ